MCARACVCACVCVSVCASGGPGPLAVDVEDGRACVACRAADGRSVVGDPVAHDMIGRDLSDAYARSI